MEFYATCPAGLEDLLAQELASLKLANVRKLVGMVWFEGELEDAYTACLWSRLASGVIAVLASFPVATDAHASDTLYAGVQAVDWPAQLAATTTFAVAARGESDNLNNSLFVARRVKDAIVDQFYARQGTRPNVDTQHPQLTIRVRLRQGHATVGLDLSGDALFRRGYERTGKSVARLTSLRADYAAALLAAGGWYRCVRHAELANKKAARAAAEAPSAASAAYARKNREVAALYPVATPTLVGAMTGTGTLLVEAAQMAQDRAPGLLHLTWGFEDWKQHDEKTWNKVVRAAERKAQKGAAKPVRLLCVDVREGAGSAARAMLRSAGIEAPVETVTARELAQVGPALAAGVAVAALGEHAGSASGRTSSEFIGSDGANGEGGKAPASNCLLDKTALVAIDTSWIHADELAVEAEVMSQVSELAASLFDARNASADSAGVASPAVPGVVFERDYGVEALLNKPASSAHEVKFSGAEATIALVEDVAAPAAQAVEVHGERLNVLMKNSDQFAARLAKVGRERAKWARDEDVTCYRVYDADLPDYNVSIDRYEGGVETPGSWLVINEYAAPAEIGQDEARRRLVDVMAIAPAELNVAARDVRLRVRTRDKGGSQYAQVEGVAEGAEKRRKDKGTGRAERFEPRAVDGKGRVRLPRGAKLIEEGGLTFEVNFDERLDPGIFLDTRDVRAELRERMKQTQGSKRFLNLFAYTGTATCYAADGGAKYTTTVDMSKPYLAWASRNMARNGFVGENHEYVCADVIGWVSEQRKTRNRWDLIYCDPPTFSNSKSMKSASWDVQRDHAELLIGLSRLLTANGLCVFCCNLRSFTPDVEKLNRYGVEIEDITAATIPHDFERNQKVHHCYLVRRTPRPEGFQPRDKRPQQRDRRNQNSSHRAQRGNARNNDRRGPRPGSNKGGRRPSGRP
jgi:23S rRNA (guanine2445-N2)-methyltransferase / 23S rRNA (guanine2069-N7)-methyltransferase